MKKSENFWDQLPLLARRAAENAAIRNIKALPRQAQYRCCQCRQHPLDRGSRTGSSKAPLVKRLARSCLRLKRTVRVATLLGMRSKPQSLSFGTDTRMQRQKYMWQKQANEQRFCVGRRNLCDDLIHGRFDFIDPVPLSAYHLDGHCRVHSFVNHVQHREHWD